MRTVDVPLVMWEPSPALDKERSITLRRPCECGCDNRNNATLVGYINGITNGWGFTMEIHDEETFQHMEKVFGENT